MRMSWQYIAGFFDGEGSVGLYRDHHSGKASMSVSIPQSEKNNGMVVLGCIREFLEKQGVTIKSVSKNSGPIKHGGSPIYSLHINRLESLRLFLSGVLPYVIVKKVAVQDHLRYLKLFPDLTPYRYQIRNMVGKGTRFSDEDVVRIKVLRALRLCTQRKLALEYGVARTTIGAIESGRNWKRLLPFIGDNSAYHQYYPSQKFVL